VVLVIATSTAGKAGERMIDKQVLVRSGKYAGEIGTVVKSGHGFYCVEIPGRGEVMKRAYELDTLDGGAGSGFGMSSSPDSLDIERELDSPALRGLPPLNRSEFTAANILVDLRRNSSPAFGPQTPTLMARRRVAPSSTNSTPSRLARGLSPGLASLRNQVTLPMRIALWRAFTSALWFECVQDSPIWALAGVATANMPELDLGPTSADKSSAKEAASMRLLRLAQSTSVQTQPTQRVAQLFERAAASAGVMDSDADSENEAQAIYGAAHALEQLALQPARAVPLAASAPSEPRVTSLLS